MTGEDDIAVLPAISRSSPAVPALFVQAGDAGARRLLEWFTAEIRNPNTRASYRRAVFRFCNWCQHHRLQLKNLQPVHAAAYVEELATRPRKKDESAQPPTGMQLSETATKPLSKPTVKQHLAALRMLGDYLVTGQVIAANPFGPVRGPKYVVKTGKTTVLTGAEMRQLLDSINMTVDEHGNRTPNEPHQFTIADLRDRALIAVMAYSFSRISAVLSMTVGDYRQQGKRCWLVLHEKGGKHHEVPCHHIADEYLDAYLIAAGIIDDKQSPLFRRLDRRRRLTSGRLDRREALAMVKRRAIVAGLGDLVCNHSFRATGITVYLQNGGTLERAAAIAAHESPRTTKLYDRTADKISLDEVERIRFE
jgi:integrase/recombinase XerD